MFINATSYLIYGAIAKIKCECPCSKSRGKITKVEKYKPLFIQKYFITHTVHMSNFIQEQQHSHKLQKYSGVIIL